MSRILSFLLFLSIFSAVMYGIHYFIFTNISKHIGLSDKLLNYIKWFIILSGISIVAGPILSRFLQIHFIKQYGFIWLGSASIIFSLFLAAKIFMLIFQTKHKQIVIISLVISFFIIIYSVINQASKPVVKSLEIYTKKGESGFKNLSIVQLSDMHIDNSTNINRIISIVETINSLNPDLIVITGDLIDGPVSKNNHIIAQALKNLRSKYGVYAVTGNHEYYSGIKNFFELAKNCGICVLNDKTININEQMDLTGITDHSSARAKKNNPGSYIFMNKLDKKKINILLSHRPYGFEMFMKMGIDLQLSGHTHAGQIPPMDLIVQIFYKFPYGLYRIGDSYIYTSSGTGIWGPPMRFLSDSEIVHIKIKKI